MQLLSFVIPCYHSAATLAAVTREIRETVLADGRYAYEFWSMTTLPMIPGGKFAA